MIDIPSIFKNKKLDADKLTACGFHSTQTGYENSFPIMQDQYRVVISITSDGTADFRVFDCETSEEYIPAHVYHSTGSFVGEVHKEWFAVVGRIPREKIGIEEGGLAEVINLKDEPEAVTARINEKKAYPAYHMNKQHWYTVLLDDRLADDEMINLIKISFKIVNS